MNKALMHAEASTAHTYMYNCVISHFRLDFFLSQGLNDMAKDLGIAEDDHSHDDHVHE